MICLYVTRWVNLDYIPEKMENILERVNRENKTSHSCVIGWEELHARANGVLRKVWAQTKNLSPNICYLVPIKGIRRNYLADFFR